MDLVVFTDLGLDDALALVWLIDHTEVTVAAVVAAAGNVSSQSSDRNVRVLLRAAGRRDIPVFHTRGVRQNYQSLPAVHGEDGLGDFEPPLAEPPRGGTVGKRSLSELPQQIGSATPLQVLCLSPCTALRAALGPLDSRVSRIHLMGGRIDEPGNFDGASEFNFGLAPEAATAVIDESAPRVVPLDFTRQFPLGAGSSPLLIQEPESNRELFRKLATRYRGLAELRGGTPVPHDLVAAWSLLNSDRIEWHSGRFDTADQKLRLSPEGGALIATRLSASGEKPKMASRTGTAD